jgi:hypothetical protein
VQLTAIVRGGTFHFLHRRYAMIQLPYRDRDQATRALHVFLATCELAAEQFQLAAERLDAIPPLSGQNQEDDDSLRLDVADALMSVRFFQRRLARRADRRELTALTAALRSLAPSLEASVDPRRRLRAMREWPAMLAVFWLDFAIDALEHLGGDAMAIAAIVFRHLTDMIDGMFLDEPAGAAVVQAVRDYLGDRDEATVAEGD